MEDKQADKQAELDRLLVEFEAAGGRGVELADRIDALRAELEGDDCDSTVPWDLA